MFSALSVLLLLTLLQIKHCYADFFLQTYMQTVKKGIWLHPIGVSHTLEHVYCTLIALALFSLYIPLGVITIVTLAVMEGVIHYIIDYSKVKYGSKDNTKPIYWQQFGMDQLAHQITYVAMALWIVHTH